jgi:hypothetical protein
MEAVGHNGALGDRSQDLVDAEERWRSQDGKSGLRVIPEPTIHCERVKRLQQGRGVM